MEILSRYRFVFLFLTGAIAAVLLGNFAWHEKKNALISSSYARHSFLLLDDSGQLFGTRNLKEDEKILLIFIPDYLQEHVYQELRQFSAFLPTLKAKKIEVALVSRGTVDGGTSLKQASQYSGRILRDPSGSIGRILGAWSSFAPVQDWRYALVDKGMHIIWSASADHVLQLSDLPVKF